MKRLALLLLIVLMALLAVPAWADSQTQTIGSGGKSPAGSSSGGLIGSGT